MNLLAPLPVTSIVSSTIPEPAATETAWVSGGTYAAGDLRIRAITHREYLCIQAHTGRTALPEVDPLFWRDLRATKRFAPFDYYRSTQATTITSMSYTLALGFVNAVDLYGLSGLNCTLTVRQGSGGTVLFTETRSLYEPAPGLYEYLFAPSRAIDTLAFDGLPIHPDAHITIDITASSGAKVGLGIAALGQRRTLFDPAKGGGAEYGASAEPKTTSYIKIDETFGEVEIVRRAASTDLDVTVFMDEADAAYAVALVQEVLDVPVSWRVLRGTDPGFATYRWISTFGLGSGRMVAEGPTHARLNLQIKGFI